MNHFKKRKSSTLFLVFSQFTITIFTYLLFATPPFAQSFTHKEPLQSRSTLSAKIQSTPPFIIPKSILMRFRKIHFLYTYMVTAKFNRAEVHKLLGVSRNMLNLYLKDLGIQNWRDQKLIKQAYLVLMSTLAEYFEDDLSARQLNLPSYELPENDVEKFELMSLLHHYIDTKHNGEETGRRLGLQKEAIYAKLKKYSISKTDADEELIYKKLLLKHQLSKYWIREFQEELPSTFESPGKVTIKFHLLIILDYLIKANRNGFEAAHNSGIPEPTIRFKLKEAHLLEVRDIGDLSASKKSLEEELVKFFSNKELNTGDKAYTFKLPEKILEKADLFVVLYHLLQSNGNQTKAARAIGITPQGLRALLSKHQVKKITTRRNFIKRYLSLKKEIEKFVEMLDDIKQIPFFQAV